MLKGSAFTNDSIGASGAISPSDQKRTNSAVVESTFVIDAKSKIVFVVAAPDAQVITGFPLKKTAA
jgi:hypothetical protein